MIRLILILLAVRMVDLAKAQTGEERISLNGLWKFKTLVGEGSNYLDITPEAGDILIDNKQWHLLNVTGEWELVTESERSSKCWDEGYLRHRFDKGSDPAYVRFKSQVPEIGY